MQHVDTVVVGAGHAGLAVSHLLSAAGRDHVVLERGTVAHSWRTQRWDSLRLLTPGWLSRLPGYHPIADDDGYPTVAEVVAHLTWYADYSDAPVLENTTVLSVRRCGDRWLVVTDGPVWSAEHVVVASGHATVPAIPAGAARLPAGVHQLHPLAYRNPDEVRGRHVLVVGASASGAQIADELAGAGHRVTLAVGRHTRLPRRHRGRDILWWLDRAGVLDRTIDEVRDREAARRTPSMQLVGDGERSIDLPALAGRGVVLAGRVTAVDDDGSIRLADDLGATTAEADARMHALLDRLDADAARRTGRDHVAPAPRPRPVELPARPVRRLHPGRDHVDTVVWATGFRGDYSYLDVPRLLRDGDLPQYRGATPAPGLFVIGQRFGHRRRSSFIDGARFDAADIVTAITRRAPAALAG